MKLRIAGAVLLLGCFVCLAVMSGAIPVATEAEAASMEEPIFSGKEAPSTEAETVTEASTPGPAPSPTAAPEPTETPMPEEETHTGPEVVTTTITGDDILYNTTYYDVDTDELTDGDYHLPLSGDGYQILIVHTHTTEAYTPTAEEPYDAEEEYHTTDPDHSVVRVGQALADALGKYGLHVLHDTTIHDYPSYNGSYARSGETIEAYLDAYPGILIVIDLHRDALGDGEVIYSTDAGIDGVRAAQLLFVMGSDVNLEHPGWRENLKLALTLQDAVCAQWPQLMRPIKLCDYRYNQQLTPGSLLLEVGTSGNTLEEALTSAELFAEAVGPVLASWVE